MVPVSKRSHMMIENARELSVYKYFHSNLQEKLPTNSNKETVFVDTKLDNQSLPYPLTCWTYATDDKPTETVGIT